MVGREIKGIVGIVFILSNFMVKLFYHMSGRRRKERFLYNKTKENKDFGQNFTLL